MGARVTHIRKPDPHYRPFSAIAAFLKDGIHTVPIPDNIVQFPQNPEEDCDSPA